MPRIQWTGLPPALRDHLFDRLRLEKVGAGSMESQSTGRYMKAEYGQFRAALSERSAAGKRKI